MREEQIPVMQLEQRIFAKLVDAIKIDKLLEFESNLCLQRQKSINPDMMERMYMYHAFRILDEESFTTCQFCAEIYPLAKANKMKCLASHDFFVDNSEQSI